MSEPLIHTARGNLPVASLRYEHSWEDTPEALFFKEFWFAEDGELVKNNCHGIAKKQFVIGGEQAAL